MIITVKKDVAVLSGLVKHPYHFRETSQYLPDIPAQRCNKMLQENTTAVLLLYCNTDRDGEDKQETKS